MAGLRIWDARLHLYRVQEGTGIVSKVSIGLPSMFD